jgi:hypothetical protein
VAGKRDQLKNTDPFARPGERPTLEQTTGWLLRNQPAQRDEAEVIIRAPDGALVPTEDNALRVGAFRLTSAGLIIDEGATLDQWEYVGGVLRQMDAAMQWLVGDWVNFGEHEYGKTYQQIADLTGYEIKTVYTYAEVARKVQFPIRMGKLSFAHHQLVAPHHDDPDLQARFLQIAIDEGEDGRPLSVAKLRARIAEELGEQTPHDQPATPLAAKEHRQRFLSVFNALRTGKRPKPEDVKWLRTWVDALENL